MSKEFKHSFMHGAIILKMKNYLLDKKNGKFIFERIIIDRIKLICISLAITCAGIAEDTIPRI